MSRNLVKFEVTRLSATAPEGVPIEWQGREFLSGPLQISLDEAAGLSAGQLDYSRRRAEAEFHVRLELPEFAGLLAEMGMDPAFGQPIRAVLRSQGEILDDHGFALSGGCDIEPHAMFAPGEVAGRVLPGH